MKQRWRKLLIYGHILQTLDSTLGRSFKRLQRKQYSSMGNHTLIQNWVSLVPMHLHTLDQHALYSAFLLIKWLTKLQFSMSCNLAFNSGMKTMINVSTFPTYVLKTCAPILKQLVKTKGNLPFIVIRATTMLATAGYHVAFPLIVDLEQR